VAFKAQGSYPVVMGFDAPTLAVTKLIGVGGTDGAII
jgi:hypothetical protein